MVRLPPHAPGLRVGLYGGSFNPPHAGHLHVSGLAMKRLRLDRIWWMVTPGNPLKDQSSLPPAAARLRAARALARRPGLAVTAFEEDIGAKFTVDALSYLVLRCPDVRFVWIMGADCLAGFHRWRGWRRIAGLMPFAVVDRPGWTLRAAQARAAVALRRYPRRKRRSAARRHGPAGLGVPARAALGSVIHRSSRKEWPFRNPGD